MRSLDEPYYNLLSREGRHDIRFAINHHGWSSVLVSDIIGDTWFGIKFKLNKIKDKI